MSLTNQINTLNSWANDCRLILWALEDDLSDETPSGYQLGQNGGVGWIAWDNREVLRDLIEAMQYFVYGHSSSFNYVNWINVHEGLYNWEHDQGLAKWILQYTAAHDDLRAGHRMIIDAYNASMYDKPFDQEYHTLWVQRFKSWG